MLRVGVRNYTRHTVPSVAFARIARDVFPDTYELSIACVGDTRAREANKRYRKKTYAPNVLSFPLSETVGEILLNVSRIRKEARVDGHNPRDYLLFLFIHSVLHLLGYHHGDTMENKEYTLRRKYNIDIP